jgi:hypothetical protein
MDAVSATQLRELFWDFVCLDRLTGGPDTHLDMIAHMSRDMDWRQGLWMAGCYVSVYNVPSGFRMWEQLPWGRTSQDRKRIADFVEGNWDGLSFRRERRAVRSIPKLIRHLNSYADWIERVGPSFFDRKLNVNPETRYRWIWDSLDERVWGLGRYALMKIMETYTRQQYVELSLPDIRPVGGDSPRDQLAELYDTPSLRRGNTKRDLADVAERVEHLRWQGRRQRGVDITMFQAEVYLCEFKQATKHNQYPGRALDSEFGHYTKTADHFGEWPDFFRIRREMFPEWALGECNGWQKRRDELGDCIPDHRYVWSDLKYDYHQTTKQGLSQPVPRNEPVPDGGKPICQCRYSEVHG